MNLRLVRDYSFVGALSLSFFAACDTGTGGTSAENAPSSPSFGETVAGEAPVSDEVEATELDEVIDDFEDGDLTFRVSRSNGNWAADDEGVVLSVAAEGGDDTESSLQAVFPDGGGAFAASMTPQGVSIIRNIDYSSCTGMQFWARTEVGGASSVAVQLRAGSGSAAATAELASEWQQVQLGWSDFEAVAGAQVGDTLGALESIAFASDQAGEVWIDELTLLGCQLLIINPPMPDPAQLEVDAPEGSPVARYGHLRVEGAKLVDQSGEPVQLKGISSTWLNYETAGYAEDKGAMEWLRDNWNMTVFRAAMGVDEGGSYLSYPERERGKVETIVENAIELGVYVIIDWHSHVADARPAQARAFFAEMAEKYGDTPNVLYETFNEPTQQNWATALKPYHETVIASIRSIDPDNIIILGNPRWSQLPIDGARDPIGASNIMYTLHFYTCTHRATLRSDADAAMAAGAAIFVTEWGATNADGGLDGIVCADDSIPWLEWMEENKLSWAAWKWDACADASCFVVSGANISDGLQSAEMRGHAELVREWMLR